MDCCMPASLSFTISESLLKLMSIESMMPSNSFILCYPLPLLPSISSSIGVFSNESALHIKGPKYVSFSFSISPSNEYSGLISFRNDWFDLFAVRGTLKSLLQHHNLKASILRCSAFFMVQTSYLYMTTADNSFDYMDLWLQSDFYNGHTSISLKERRTRKRSEWLNSRLYHVLRRKKSTSHFQISEMRMILRTTVLISGLVSKFLWSESLKVARRTEG